MTEPEWIEHDGSAVCPVPAGHDVEVRFRGKSGGRDTCPEIWRWSRHNNATDITHYRDWTAWEQSKMSKTDDVPEWALERAADLAMAEGMESDCRRFSGPYTAPLQEAFARYIAAREQPPVDLVREIVTEIAQAILSDAFLDDDAAIEHAIEVARAIIPPDVQAMLRARGVTPTNAGTMPEGE